MARPLYIKRDANGDEWLVQRVAGWFHFMVARRENIPIGEKYLDEYTHIYVSTKDTYPRDESQWNVDKAFEVAMDMMGIPHNEPEQ